MNFSLEFLARYKHKQEMNKLKLMSKINREIETNYDDMISFLRDELQSLGVLPIENLSPPPAIPRLTTEIQVSSDVSTHSPASSVSTLSSSILSQSSGKADVVELDILSDILLADLDSADSEFNFDCPSKLPTEDELLKPENSKKTVINSSDKNSAENTTISKLIIKSEKPKISSKIEVPKRDKPSISKHSPSSKESNCVLICTHNPTCAKRKSDHEKIKKSSNRERSYSHSSSGSSFSRNSKRQFGRRKHDSYEEKRSKFESNGSSRKASSSSRNEGHLNKGKRIVLLSSKRLKMNHEMQQPNSSILSGAYDVCIRRLKCLHDECNIDFESKIMHEQHMREAHNSFAELCPLASCNRSFQDKNHWTHHVQVDHSNVSRWQCAKCNTSWNSSDLLYGHNVLCHVEGLYECLHPGCDYASRIRKPVIDHYEELGRLNMDEIDGLHLDKYFTLRTVCPLNDCLRVLPDKSEYQKHLLDTHRIEYNMCLECDDSFRHRSQLRSHIDRDHSDVDSWACSKCDKSFRNHPTLFTHNFLCHFEGEFKCAADGCEYIGITRATVIHHFDQNHPKIICRLSLSDLAFGPTDLAFDHQIDKDDDLLDTESLEAHYNPSSIASSSSTSIFSSATPSIFGRSTSSSLETDFYAGVEDPRTFQITIHNGGRFSQSSSSSPPSSLTSLYQRRYENVLF